MGQPDFPVSQEICHGRIADNNAIQRAGIVNAFDRFQRDKDCFRHGMERRYNTRLGAVLQGIFGCLGYRFGQVGEVRKACF